MQTMTLTDFLGARLAEDEVRVTVDPWHRRDCDTLPAPGYEYTYPCDCGVPARMRREVEVKRAIVARHVEEYPGSECNHCVEPLPCPDLRALASVYADHPDYRDLGLS